MKTKSKAWSRAISHGVSHPQEIFGVQQASATTVRYEKENHVAARTLFISDSPHGPKIPIPQKNDHTLSKWTRN